MSTTSNSDSLESIEARLLTEGVYQRYGLDFRDYSTASLTRRILKCVSSEALGSISALQEKVLRDPACMDRLVGAITIHVTSMFRDPGMYKVFRQRIIPILRTYPFVRVWCAGCSTGEEVYSLAIVLVEEGLYKKSRIYATDLSEAVLDRAKSGIFPLQSMKEYTENYQMGGGARPFSDYYTADHENAIFGAALRENVVFARHNLASEASFNEFNLVLCRNVMIYFNKTLSERVHGLFYQSLAPLGFLCLGSRESIRFSPHENCYETFESTEKIYRKVK